MVVVQRVRVRWGATARGSVQANVRRTVADIYRLPPFPSAESLVVHEVLVDEATGYRPVSQAATGDDAARAAGLHIERFESVVVVDRLPGWAAYPVRRTPARLFTLTPGQVGRYRANFRFTGCACAPSWFYEAWTVRVAYCAAQDDLFLNATVEHDVDHRVHLYGGRERRSAKVRSA